MLSLLSAYFTLIQQRELNNLDVQNFRLWLWDGTFAPAQDGWMRSSLASNTLLQAPFEFLGIAIALFLAGLGCYLGLAYASQLSLSAGKDSNLAVLLVVTIACGFSLLVVGQGIGQKHRELVGCRKQVHKRRGGQQVHRSLSVTPASAEDVKESEMYTQVV
jgi:hypothetical protein